MVTVYNYMPMHVYCFNKVNDVYYPIDSVLKTVIGRGIAWYIELPNVHTIYMLVCLLDREPWAVDPYILE